MEYPEYPQDNRVLFKPEIPKDKILVWKKDLDRKKLGYSEKSLRHPAKMHIRLAQWILEKFTKPGETICDPMAGIGTTGIEAMRLGRNCLMVEYEQKFVDWTEESIRNLEKQEFIGKRGKVRVLRGDARELTRILPEHVDEIVFSPPFSQANKGGGIAKKGYEGKHGKDEKLHERHERQLSEDKNNISNLPHGEINHIIMSPPHSEGIGHSQGKRAGKDKIGKDRFYGYYADGDKNNIGNIKKHGDIDAVVMSPPYSSISLGGLSAGEARKEIQKLVKKSFKEKGYFEYRGKRYTEKEWLKLNHGRYDGRCVIKWGSESYSKDKNSDNIGNLPQGDIDAVIMSPPYAKSVSTKTDPDKRIARLKKAGYLDKKDWRRPNTIKTPGRNAVFSENQYSEDPENIGNLPQGSIDAIITSPPYQDVVKEGKEGTGATSDRGRWKREFSGKKKPTGSGYSEVDAIITSPPYEGVMDSKRHTDSGICGRDPKMTKMRYSNVDTIITSPPYEDIYGASRHGEKARMQKTKLHKEKRLGFPYTTEQTDNLGNLKGKTYLSEMKKVYEQCYAVLKPGGKAIIVTKNFTRNYKMVRLDMDTILLMESIGFRLVDRYFRKLTSKSFWIRNYEKKFREEFPDKPLPTAQYEDILIFQKNG